jgi:hypothetical protein
LSKGFLSMLKIHLKICNTMSALHVDSRRGPLLSVRKVAQRITSEGPVFTQRVSRTHHRCLF